MFFGRPISILIIVASILTLLYPFVTAYLAARRRGGGLAGADQAATPMKYRDTGSIVLALLFIAIGIFAITGTADMTPLGAVFPTTIAFGLIAFCLLLIADHLRRPRAPGTLSSADPAATPASAWRRATVAAALAAWIVLIPQLGFAVASALGFVGVTAIANHDRLSPVRALAYAGVALITVAAFYALMAQVLLIRMPAGLFF
jgi:putative tricarboxylic transport membrane protein